jgi:hypothetical protein
MENRHDWRSRDASNNHAVHGIPKCIMLMACNRNRIFKVHGKRLSVRRRGKSDRLVFLGLFVCPKSDMSTKMEAVISLVES